MPSKADTLKIHAVDLFCGIGGLTQGLSLAGIDVRAGIDVDPSCQRIYEANHPGAQFVTADVRYMQFRDVAPYYEDADITVLAGCAPCQPFSAYTRKRKRQAAGDCSLVDEFARLIQESRPDFVSMENVPGLSKHQTFNNFLATLYELAYRYAYGILSCLDYGVPQNRKRLVLLASRLGTISLPRPTNRIMTVEDFIRDLPSVEDGEASSDDPAHVTLPLSIQNKRRIRQSKPGGSWRDWDSHLVNPCHRKAHYPASYGRMIWNAPAPTITTQFCYYSTGRFGHPDQDRTISVREAALLQTFPVHYALTDQEQPLVIRRAARHIGNAVPVQFAQALGQSIQAALHG